MNQQVIPFDAVSDGTFSSGDAYEFVSGKTIDGLPVIRRSRGVIKDGKVVSGRVRRYEYVFIRKDNHDAFGTLEFVKIP